PCSVPLFSSISRLPPQLHSFPTRRSSDLLLHVADRENDRIQVFDLDGNHQRTYGGFAPFGIFITPDQTLFVADGRAHKALHMTLDRKSTRLNSSHVKISYAVFCLKKKTHK